MTWKSEQPTELPNIENYKAALVETQTTLAALQAEIKTLNEQRDSILSGNHESLIKAQEDLKIIIAKAEDLERKNLAIKTALDERQELFSKEYEDFLVIVDSHNESHIKHSREIQQRHSTYIELEANLKLEIAKHEEDKKLHSESVDEHKNSVEEHEKSLNQFNLDREALASEKEHNQEIISNVKRLNEETLSLKNDIVKQRNEFSGELQEARKCLAEAEESKIIDQMILNQIFAEKEANQSIVIEQRRLLDLNNKKLTQLNEQSAANDEKLAQLKQLREQLANKEA